MPSETGKSIGANCQPPLPSWSIQLSGEHPGLCAAITASLVVQCVTKIQSLTYPLISATAAV